MQMVPQRSQPLDLMIWYHGNDVNHMLWPWVIRSQPLEHVWEDCDVITCYIRHSIWSDMLDSKYLSGVFIIPPGEFKGLWCLPISVSISFICINYCFPFDKPSVTWYFSLFFLTLWCHKGLTHSTFLNKPFCTFTIPNYVFGLHE